MTSSAVGEKKKKEKKAILLQQKTGGCDKVTPHPAFWQPSTTCAGAAWSLMSATRRQENGNGKKELVVK